jgi:hypothetical protein
MRRDHAIVALATAVLAAAPAWGRGVPDQAAAAGPSAPRTAQGSITARATVLATGPDRAALAAGDSLLAGAGNGVLFTADGTARISRHAVPAPGPPVLVVEFVAN